MKLQETYDLMRSANEIRLALETDGDRIGELLNEKHPEPAGEGDPVFDHRAQMRHLVHQLDSALDQVVIAEEKHSIRRIRFARTQRERDALVLTNHNKLVTTRDALESIFPHGSYEMAFVVGKTPRVPFKLLEQLQQSADLLRRPAVAPLTARTPNAHFDFEGEAAYLEAGIPELRALIDQANTLRKKTEGQQLIRRKAIDQLHRTILWVGRTAEGLFHLADESELAGRIRSSTRRPKRPSEETQETTGEGPTDVDSETPATDEPSDGEPPVGESDDTRPDPPATNA